MVLAPRPKFIVDSKMAAGNLVERFNKAPDITVGLSFLASAIAGCPLKVRISDTQEQSYFDGQSIILAPSLNAHQQGIVVMLHAALVAAGSLESDMLKGINLRPSVSRRYFSLEVPRAIEHCRQLVPSRLLSQLVLPPSASHAAEFSLERSRDHRQNIDLLPDWMGKLRPRLLAKTAKEQVRLLDNAGRMKTFTIKELPKHDEDEELDESGAKLLNLFSNPLAKSSWFSDMLRDILGMGRGGQSEEEGSAGGMHGEGAAYQAGVVAGTSDNAHSVDALPEKIELLYAVSDWQYPEWDERKERYRENWVSVNEVDVPADAIIDVLGEHHRLESCGLSPHSLAQQLIKVGAEFENHRRQPQGSDIDVDALVEHFIDRAAGHSNEESIYCSSQRTRRDLSAMMLVDLSRSTADIIEPGKTIFGQQLHVARLISTVLSKFGDRVAIYGFHSWGRAMARLIRIKRFDELDTAVIDERILALKPSGLTRLGAAIRHASFRIQQEKYHTHRLLIVLTDGFAYDDEYEGRYAEADAAKALEEARQQGVACVCISIGTEKGDEALARIFGVSTYLRCNQATELPGKLKRLAITALKKVERSSKSSLAAKHSSIF